MIKLKKLMRLVLILALVTILSATSFAKEDSVKLFSDVPENHWSYKAIHDLRSLGITDGIGNNRFGMGQTIKRSEFVTFLTKLMNWELIKPEKGSFVDNQDPAKWYYAPVETALKHGTILKDTERFRPDDPINREEMAIMIVRTLGYNSLAGQINNSKSSFDDVTENTGYIAIARDFGIISGVGNNLFKPYDTAKREEAAVMMMKMYEKLNIKIKELHAFYAIHSAHQMDKISSLDSVSFGWSRLEYDVQSKQVFLNTTGRNNNQFSFPEGFTGPLNKAKEYKTSTQLMVFASNNTVFSTETKSNIPLVEYI
ncbi:MAG TPA: S-layer homology domain-containing protein, partial [Acetivibrio sp.]|nr:S-layer homology domain-containing protein [Acetivibrio sp.]